MENFLDKLTAFLFGKHLKLVLFICGILSCLATINSFRSTEGAVIGWNIRYGLMSVGFIFTAVYLHSKESGNK